MYLNLLLGNERWDKDSGHLRVPLSVYVYQGESSPTKDRINAVAGGKRGRPKKQEAGACGEDQRAEGATRPLRESASLLQVRRQATDDNDDTQWNSR